MFSNRTDWDVSPNRFTEIAGRLKASGGRLYDLTVSNPARCGFQSLSENILLPFSDARNLTYDPNPFGLLSARQAVSGYYARQGITIPPERIVLTASTSEAYGFLFRLLADPGDDVAFPKPGYPLFDFLAGLHDLGQRPFVLAYDGARWALDRQRFCDAASGGVRAVILVNPNNPTGSCLTPDEIGLVMRETARRGIPVICDEVFLDYCEALSGACSLAGRDEALTFVLGGISKTLGLPQMKCSWIVMSGPDDLVKEAAGRLEVIADTFLSVNTPAQNALAAWLDMRPQIQGEILSRVRANRAFLIQEVSCLGEQAHVLNADGGWSAVVHCLQMADEESFALALLEEEHVMVHPGYFFDFLEEGYVVLSLLGEEALFQEGVRRMVQRMGSLR